MANERMKKLELTWAGKDRRMDTNGNPYDEAEPRILLDQKDKAYGDNDTENMLIHGDNLLALKSLETNPDIAGKVKCIYIDPPYNTGNAFDYYDDGYEHSIWLSLMRDRLEILRNLLSEDGVIFVQIDDSESAYLKVLLDEVFGRNNYEVTFYVQVRYAGKTLAEKSSYQKLIENIHCYRKSPLYLPKKEQQDYSLDGFCWEIETTEPTKTVELKGRKVEIFLEDRYTIKKVPAAKDKLKETWATGTVLKGNASGKFFGDYLAARVAEDGLKVLYKVYGIGEDGLGYRYFTGPKKEDATKGKFYSGVPLTRLEEMENGGAKKEKPIENFFDFAGSFGNCRHEGNADFRGGKKPEALIKRILEMATNEGDLVLDSFLGSGSTAAVAHKMGRRWIGIELGDHAYSHCLPRLKAIVDGTDQGGISKDVGWTGGGGFKFYELASSLIVKDGRGFDVISKEYNGDMLAEAMCKIMGYKYRPDKAVFWKQGVGTEQNYLFTTTMTLTEEYLEEIHEKLGAESLLICCGGFTGNKTAFKNITIKKIPKAILEKCEWNKPGYPLPVKEDFTEQDFEIEAE